ncbi:hypothetical protein [Rubritalea tangerina]|uniref:hypothetical protein n=1 Tax=Rubritalea tangerina TaxID=430798 RepID=UPI003619BB1E
MRGVADKAFCFAGGYVGVEREDFTVLAKTQPLVSMDPKADPDPKKKPMPSVWVRHYQGKGGRKAGCFTRRKVRLRTYWITITGG